MFNHLPDAAVAHAYDVETTYGMLGVATLQVVIMAGGYGCLIKDTDSYVSIIAVVAFDQRLHEVGLVELGHAAVYSV